MHVAGLYEKIKKEAIMADCICNDKCICHGCGVGLFVCRFFVHLSCTKEI